MDEDSLKKILSRLGIQVAARNGEWLQFSCPFAKWLHATGRDNSPSCGARINQEGISAYKCFSCKKSGRISSLVRSLEYFRDKEYKGLALDADLADASMSYGDFEDPEVEPDELPESLNENGYGDLYGNAWDVFPARKYLKNRGIGKDTARFLNLGFDAAEERIIFPVRHTDGKLYGFTGRSILDEKDYPYKTYKKVRDYLGLPKRHLLLGAELVDKKKPLFIVEGLFGYAHLFEILADDICNPIALLGSEMTNPKADMIREWDRLTVLALDNDEGGEHGLFGSDTKPGAIKKLESHVPLIVPVWPEDKRDPDELTFDDVEDMLNAPLHQIRKDKRYAG